MVKKAYFEPVRWTTMVKVSDEWYPCFPNQEVRLSVIQLPQFRREDPMTVRICVWGADDFGMEVDYHVASNGDRKAKYRELIRYAEKIKKLEPLSVKFFQDAGFHNA